MKKIEILLIKSCHFLNRIRPSVFTFFLFLLFGFIAFLIHKYRKKDNEDIQEQKQWDRIFSIQQID